MTVSAANIHPSVTGEWRWDRDTAPPNPFPPKSRLARRSAAAKNKVQSTSAKMFPKMWPANGGDGKRSQENVGGAKNPSEMRTDDLGLDLVVSICHIYTVPKVWEHSTRLYINKCNNNTALCCFSSLPRNQNAPQRREALPFDWLIRGLFSPPPVFDAARKRDQNANDFALRSQTATQGSDGPVSHHLCESGAWNASESYRCLHCVSAPGGGLRSRSALQSKHPGGVFVRSFEASRSKSGDHELMLSF